MAVNDRDNQILEKIVKYCEEMNMLTVSIIAVLSPSAGTPHIVMLSLFA